MTNEGYYIGPVLGFPPTVIVCATAVEEFVSDYSVFQAGVKYTREYDEETENEILSLIQSSPDARDFSWESKLESLREVERAQGSMPQIGAGIALILALIGILNYVNTVTGNIQSRQMELAVLESIGMTDRQRNRMLVTEGMIFAAGSLFITGTVGVAVTYAVYQSMNYMLVPFEVPAGPVVGDDGVYYRCLRRGPSSGGSEDDPQGERGGEDQRNERGIEREFCSGLLLIC